MDNKKLKIIKYFYVYQLIKHERIKLIIKRREGKNTNNGSNKERGNNENKELVVKWVDTALIFNSTNLKHQLGI
ncbi:hypothetical protein [Proteus hauseri]|uniref:hypothetical protein n=1 Tax=Proteus hauseri TaxID=183417 RepID=UPI0010094659|nr:hypothetical protein [Proteus hauseri]QAV23833.1 hypothetical protein PH4a_10985 [Proteus hauseri]